MLTSADSLRRENREASAGRQPPALALPQRTTRYDSLDMWRGVACLLVVLYHATLVYASSKRDTVGAEAAGTADTILGWLYHGRIGVPMFFCDQRVLYRRHGNQGAAAEHTAENLFLAPVPAHLSAILDGTGNAYSGGRCVRCCIDPGASVIVPLAPTSTLVVQSQPMARKCDPDRNLATSFRWQSTRPCVRPIVDPLLRGAVLPGDGVSFAPSRQMVFFRVCGGNRSVCAHPTTCPRHGR